MEFGEEIVEGKKSKIPLIIAISILILVMLTVVVVFGIIYVKNLIVTVKVDGVKSEKVEELLYINSTEEGQKLYLPIIKVSDFLGYKGYIGHYKNKSEDDTKCHIVSENETAMFTIDSDELMKISEEGELQYMTLDEPAFVKDGQIYTSIDGIQKAFNVLISTDTEFKNINIYTMEYLAQQYAKQFNIEKYDVEFSDKKSVLENMLIVEDDKGFGVIELLKKQYILEPKYEEIKYLANTTDFLVKSDGKYGVVGKDNTMKISTVYDEIIMMDSRAGLYLVKKDKAYGVVNTLGEVIIPLEYKQIGLDIGKYTQNGVENRYILLNEIIPVKNDQNIWALFNISGEKLTDFKYTGIGCEITPVTNSYPTLVIPSYKLIVVKSDKYYNLVNIKGTEMISGNILDAVYLKYDTIAKQNKFYMTSSNNTKVIDIEEWLISIGE